MMLNQLTKAFKMKFLSKLFRKHDEQKKDDGDINIHIASGCLAGIGYTSEIANINTSILGIVKQEEPLSHIQFTEEYFFEESVFYLMTILELEENLKYIESIINIYIETGADENDIVYQNILSNIKSLCLITARQRIQALHLKPKMNEAQLIQYFDDKYYEYTENFLNHVQCKSPVTYGHWSVGVSPRDHPLKIYLGNVADNIASSVGLSKEDKLLLPLFEVATLGLYSTILSAAQSAGNK